MIYAEDISITAERNKRSLAACRSIYARSPSDVLSKRIAILERIVGEQTDAGSFSAGGTMFMPNGGCIAEAISGAAYRKMMGSIRRVCDG